ncbi:N-acetylmuramoyl-L-alanine amidase [Adlercreutzia shanghongiae]|uniref:N-acetylmuramoyl-L-alanine amidase n=1 Tax=Adlercreutzia shanghongiae TaxID=3111773 RepID=A0ABU6IW56_9ACTN|nr:N-acetylmuramoyl-L-alanine amidase [Adlercreutzia sp. R22]MEC4294057.1 N-acetylmuramoyl-L-alanine amidase [Adlercreutzia sp. R22]
MKIAIAGGHSKKAPGASKYLDEYACDRAYVAKLIPALISAGHVVVNCSNEKADQSSELAEEVRLANESGADIFVAIHFNDGSGDPDNNPTGTETWIYEGTKSDLAKNVAKKMSANVANALGVRDRGAKGGNFYVLRKTSMPAVLLEVCFVDDKDDEAAYNATSWADLTNAVVQALAGNVVPKEPSSSPKPAASTSGAKGSKVDGKFGGTYRCNASKLNVRDRPSTSGAVVASYSKGQTVVLDDRYTIADGYVWGQYTAYSGKKRYVAVGKHTGKPEASDYLVKA